jgi:hypothetical protein
MGISSDIDFEVVMPPGVADCRTPSGVDPNPRSAMIYGFSKVQGACTVFFDKAFRAQQEALAFNRSMDLGLVAATAIINATNPAAAAAKAITITAAGVVLSKSLADEYVKIFAFNVYLGKIHEITISKMESYQTSALSGSPPANYCEAYAAVQKLATMCSLSALKSNLDAQVAIPSEVKPDARGNTKGSQGAQRSESNRVQVRRQSPPSSFRPPGPPSTSYSVVPR